MAIRMRRGSFGKFDPAKLLAGELAVVLDGDSAVADGKAMYVCFAAGDVKRVATWEDAAQLIAAQLPDVIDMAVTSGTEEALTVTAEADEGGKTVFEVSHVAKASDGTAGLDPFSQSAGERETLGTTTLVDGTTFWVPCVSVDRYGHVDGISYRKFAMPTTGIASLTKLGKVIPDGKTIEIDASGMISAKVPDGSIVFRGVVPMDEYLPTDAKSGDLYISDGIAKMWDGEAWRAMGGGVTGVKGDAETDYRTGDVNLTAANVGAYTTTEVDDALDGKADKENATASAAGLMSAADKAKLDGMTAGAQPNVIEQVRLDDATITPSDKAVNIQTGKGLRSSNGTVSASSYLTTEQAGGDTVLTLVYELEEEE